MKMGLSLIAMVIDRSGSMDKLTGDTIGGYNRFLEEQKGQPGSGLLSLTLFSDEVSFSAPEPLEEAKEMTVESYQASGFTALLDAIGEVITRIGEILSAMEESERPDKVIVVVTTDGEENRSRHYTLSTVKAMVEHQQSVYGWEFIFTGANMDAFAVGGDMGFRPDDTSGFQATPEGVQGSYSRLSSVVSRKRG